MKKSQNKRKMDGSGSLLLSIIIVFGILGAIVFSVAHKNLSRDVEISNPEPQRESGFDREYHRGCFK